MAENDNELQIILTLVDEASAKLKSITADIKSQNEQVANSTKQATQSVRDQIKEANSGFKELRRMALLATVAMAGLIATVREASHYSKEAQKTYSEFEKTIKTLSVTIGQVLAPAMSSITWLVQTLTDVIESAVAGFVKLAAFVGTFFENLRYGPAEAYRQAVEVANAATNSLLANIEESRSRVQRSLTFDQELKNMRDLEKSTEFATRVMRKSWDAVIGSMGGLESALAMAGETSKKFAKAAAAVALALAIVHTAAGVTRALEDYPFPFSLVVAGIIAAAGAIQIATIAAQKFERGGRPPVGIPSIVGEAGPELFIPDAYGTIIPNDRLSGYGSKSISIQNYIYNPVVRSEEDIEKLTEEISLRLSMEADRI